MIGLIRVPGISRSRAEQYKHQFTQSNSAGTELRLAQPFSYLAIQKTSVYFCATSVHLCEIAYNPFNSAPSELRFAQPIQPFNHLTI